jgi:hypothetical protein
MKALILALIFGLLAGLFAVSALAQTCPEGFYFETCEGPQVGGSGPCVPGCYPDLSLPPTPPPPAESRQLCFPAGCAPVTYTWFRRFLIAESELPSGYPMMGFSGPCISGSCPEIQEQAYQNLFWNARQANRAARYQP